MKIKGYINTIRPRSGQKDYIIQIASDFKDALPYIEKLNRLYVEGKRIEITIDVLSNEQLVQETTNTHEEERKRLVVQIHAQFSEIAKIAKKDHGFVKKGYKNKWGIESIGSVTSVNALQEYANELTAKIKELENIINDPFEGLPT